MPRSSAAGFFTFDYNNRDSLSISPSTAIANPAEAR